MNTLLLEVNKNKSAYAFLKSGILYEYEAWCEDASAVPGSIYLAKITRNMPAINACFADLGQQEAFLPHDEMLEKAACGDTVLVQVKRPAVGDKAPYVTQDISFAGAYVMYLPYSKRDGVSRRVKDRDKRRKLLEFAKKLPRENGAFIMRSKSLYADEQTIVSEAAKLLEQFNAVKKRADSINGTGLVEKAKDPLQVFLNDNTDAIDEFYCNDIESAEKYNLNSIYMQNPMQYKSASEQHKKALKRRVYLKSGADIIIDPCEAMTVIDVNSHVSKRAEALSVNIEAAKEIARILRLRRLGGIILIDFIDMLSKEQYNKLLEVFEEALKQDRIKTDVLGFTKLGILEMTRKRAQKAAPDINRCPVCGAIKEDNEQ